MKTKIEWATDVWNPVTGCTKVSEGCRNCYAETIAKRFWGERKFTDVQCHPDRLEAPRHWKKPRRVFVNSMSDLFHLNVRFSFVESVFETMEATPQHTYMILTKRPDRMYDYIVNWKKGIALPNVWLGVTVENQAAADERIPLLLNTPAAVRFVSIEPMLSNIDLYYYLNGCPEMTHRREYVSQDMAIDAGDRSLEGQVYQEEKWEQISPSLDWVICGGETGTHARPTNPDWVRSLRDQCQAAGVPFFFKSWGEFTSRSQWLTSNRPISCIPEKAYINDKPMGEQHIYHVGKKLAGRLLDGREWNEIPGVKE